MFLGAAVATHFLKDWFHLSGNKLQRNILFKQSVNSGQPNITAAPVTITVFEISDTCCSQILCHNGFQ